MACPPERRSISRHQVLRLDLGVGGYRLQRMLLLPRAHLAPPGAARGGQLRSAGGRIFGQQLVELPQDALHIAHDGHFRRADLAHLGRIDIHVDHLGVRREGRQAPSHAVVEAHAQRDQQVASVIAMLAA